MVMPGNWTRQRLLAVGSAIVLLIASVLVATASAGSEQRALPRTGTCHATVIKGVLPVWTRGGFSNPRPRMHYELGRAREIAAILWADPLLFPPPSDHNNKILWVSRREPDAPGFALWIHAQRMIGIRTVGSPVTRVVAGGPGPSIINLPAAGCWRINLAWSGSRDTLDLQYSNP